MHSLKDLVPFMVISTLIICGLISTKIKKENINTSDGIFSVVGFLLGLCITFLNFIYSNNYIFSLGPLLSISCLIYLQKRDKFTTNLDNKTLSINSKIMISKFMDILYWGFVAVAIYNYRGADIYQRPLIFFISISIAAAALGSKIILSNIKNNISVLIILSKIMLISLIVRASAWFISPFPVGSDPWAHYEYIKSFLEMGRIDVGVYPSETGMENYYTNYPIAHLLSCAGNLIGNFSVKESMFFISIALVLSSIFFYLIVEEIFDNKNVALLSTLLLDISEHHLLWGILIIAMSFGIAIYTFLIYLVLKRNSGKNPVIYRTLLLLNIMLIVYSHVVAAFIGSISYINIYIWQNLYDKIDKKHTYNKTLNIQILTITFTFIVVILAKMIDPKYPIFDSIIIGLNKSFDITPQLLNRVTLSNVQDSLPTLYDILGFLIYCFFGIIGSLVCLSKNHKDKIKFSLILTNLVLLFIMFSFPLFGMKNIEPFRWQVFIYITLLPFVGYGILQFLNIFNNTKKSIYFISIILLISTFFMITSTYANNDSPIIAKGTTAKLIWTESEMALFSKISNSYDGVIISDLQTDIRPFRTYLKRDNVVAYKLTPKRGVNIDYLDGKLIIYRKNFQTRSVQMGGYKHPLYYIGPHFEATLNQKFNCIYDTEEAKAYI